MSLIPKWEKGRQGSGYWKLKLLESKWFKFDMYLVFFPKDSKIVTHVDKVAGYRHYRMNIVLWKPKRGGVFHCWHADQSKLQRSRVIKFRPDIQPHGVLRITEGFRLVLSIGWLRREKNVKR